MIGLTPFSYYYQHSQYVSGQFHLILKKSTLSPCKKSTLDKDQLSNYRSVSNLSLISKIIERVVKSRLTLVLTTFSAFTSLRTVNITSLKLLFFIFMIIL